MNPIGLGLIVVSAIIPAVQLIALPDVMNYPALFSQYLGMLALILMAWGQILATRMRGLETIFGGLDRVYMLHKWAGIAAMAAMVLHDMIDAEMDELGRGHALAGLGETLGEISLNGLLVLVLMSVATFIPYHLWKWTHKAMGVMFLLGALHFALVQKPFAMIDTAGIYTGTFCVAGFLAYLWALLPDHWRPGHSYKITALNTSGDALAVTLTPEGRGLTPEPGQFGLIRFTGASSEDAHPFSFSRIDPTGDLRVTIKALGDFTTGLDRKLAVGQAVQIQGPFGRFRQPGKGPQIWIAGGIGITPFVTWARALPAHSDPVHLFICARSAATAPHLEELTALAARKPNLTLHLVASDRGQRLTAGQIANTVDLDLSRAQVAYCGPVGLRHTLRKGLQPYGVRARRFRYEEFEFRSGVGLCPMAAWIWSRILARVSQVRTRAEFGVK